jgi:ribosomal protein L18E
MKSKTKIKEQSQKKTNPNLVETLKETIKNPEWKKVASLLSGSTRNFKSINLFNIDKETKAGDTVVIVGKVLSGGELSKKVRICALNYSSKVEKKVKESKSEMVSILEEVKKNPKAEGIRLI